MARSREEMLWDFVNLVDEQHGDCLNVSERDLCFEALVNFHYACMLMPSASREQFFAQPVEGVTWQ